MKKLLTVIFLLLTCSLFSQTQKYDFLYLNFSAGPSIPIGEFASNDINNPGAGFAKVGLKGELSLGINLTPQIGLVAEVFLNSNGTKPDKMTEYLNSTFPGYRWNIESKKWNIYGLFTGLSFKTPVRKDMYVFIQAFGGFINSTSPNFLYTADSGNFSGTYNIESGTTSAMTYKLTTGLEYKLDKRFSLCGMIEYIGSKPKFKDIKTTTTFTNNTTGTNIYSSESRTSFDQTLSVFNIGLGFKYFLY
ncbi:MAG: hypothetical protein WC358_11465 [Ignavibacteria bacterium]|jgi:hypothetical protein